MYYIAAVISFVFCGHMGGPLPSTQAKTIPAPRPERLVARAAAPESATHSNPGDAVETKPPPDRISPVVRAMGIGRPPRWAKGARARLLARRAAEVVAVRNLARKLGYGSRVRLRGFRYVATEHFADGSVKLTVKYPRKVRPLRPKPVRKPRIE